MRLYHEYAISPEKRTGLMVLRTALPEIFSRPDAGYCSVYAFDESAAMVIRAQGHAQGMGRFPVYSDRLWIDIDRDGDLEAARAYTKEVARLFIGMGASLSVWLSGGKGYHVCVKIEPMIGTNVPFSQREYLRGLGVKCDPTLYQHGRLFSNPGRAHPKTGVKKHKVMDHVGPNVLTIPLVPAPERDLTSDTITPPDLVRVFYMRLGMYLSDTPEEGNRHTTLWSIAMAGFEAGVSRSVIEENLQLVNRLSVNPKPESGVCHAVDRAQSQSGAPISRPT